MDLEAQILNNIYKKRDTTQRDIARNTGMSLGNVNTLIKRLVKKGLVKIERLNAKNLQYVLTPQGIREITEATYSYIVSSYKIINAINSKIDELIRSHMYNKYNTVLFLGEKDEISELLQNKLNNTEIVYNFLLTLDELEAKVNNINGGKALVIVWQPNFAEQLSTRGIFHINLLDGIE